MNTMKSTFLNNLNMTGSNVSVLALLLVCLLVVVVDLVCVLVNIILVCLVVLRKKNQPVFERMNPLYLC